MVQRTVTLVQGAFAHSFKVCAANSCVLPPTRALLYRECVVFHVFIFSSVSESFSVVLSQVCEPVTLEIYLDMS